MTSEKNVGQGNDRIARALPPGPAKEFVRALPRRMTEAEARANSLALIALIENGARR